MRLYPNQYFSDLPNLPQQPDYSMQILLVGMVAALALGIGIALLIKK